MDPKSAHKSYHAGHKNFIPEDKILKYGFLFVVPGLLLISVLYLVFYQTRLLYRPTSTNSSIYLSPTPYPTITSESMQNVDSLTWKIYRNPQYKYSLKYPNDWRLKEQQYTDTHTDLFSPNYKTSATGKITGGGYISITIIKHASSQTVTQYYNYYKKAMGFKIVNQQAIIVDSNMGIKFEAGGNDIAYTTTGAIIKQDDILYNIEAYYVKNDKIEILKVFDQILSTFKFTQ